jgi:hypothetical protein
VPHDRVEQRAQVGRRLVERFGRRARPRVRIEDRKIELLFGRIQIDEQVEHLVQDRLRPGILPIDLVDDDDRRQPPLERFPQHEARLRQRPF